MVSIATSSARCFFKPLSVADLTPSPPVVVVLAQNGTKNRSGFASRALGPRRLGGSVFLGQSRCWVCGFSRRCKGDWDKEEDSELEEEILEFMASSGRPQAFPSKKQLIEAGRGDLVMAISERGGWLAMGWDLDEDDDAGLHWNGDIGDWDYRTSKDCGNGVWRMGDGDGDGDGDDESCGDEVGVSSFAAKSLHSVSSSSGRPLETTNEDDSGIEGILKRLEKERNIKFGLGSNGKGNNHRLQNDDDEDEWHEKVADLKRNNRANKNNDDSVQAFTQSRSISNFDGLRNLSQPAWKTWSMQRAASSNKEFEAGEIPLDESITGQTVEDTNDEFWGVTEVSRESSDTREKPNRNHIQNRLKSLELELSSVLGSLRSKADVVVPQGHQKSSEELRKLSDAGEFQENEIMNAQDKLRSIRAKLAVLEGKMALAIIDAQKIVDVKQRRIDDARKALRLLRTAFIVWTNPATKVLVVGSYDGWATKRKMEKSSAGIFSLYLKLYPGRYEIKFIVDGEWKIDPLRPIVNNGGHENNLLIIT